VRRAETAIGRWLYYCTACWFAPHGHLHLFSPPSGYLSSLKRAEGPNRPSKTSGFKIRSILPIPLAARTGLEPVHRP
jgi:hypothetical protein